MIFPSIRDSTLAITIKLDDHYRPSEMQKGNNGLQVTEWYGTTIYENKCFRCQ